MKIYTLKEHVKIGGRIVFQKGDKFFASDICKGEKGKPVYYPVGMMPDQYKPVMVGLDMTQSVGLLLASWQNSLYKGNHHLRGAKFKVVEDKTITISPEHKLFWDGIQKEIAENTKAVSTANNNLKFLNTLEVLLRVYNNDSKATSPSKEKYVYRSYTYSDLADSSYIRLKEIAEEIAKSPNVDKNVPTIKGGTLHDVRKKLLKYISNNAEYAK